MAAVVSRRPTSYSKGNTILKRLLFTFQTPRYRKQAALVAFALMASGAFV